MFDVAVIGGSFAGLTAALQLAAISAFVWTLRMTHGTTAGARGRVLVVGHAAKRKAGLKE